MSPSMRREWIEISSLSCVASWIRKSPSMRREWIEMLSRCPGACVSKSPSMRREWIEMMGVTIFVLENLSLPPCGGSGLK